MQTRAFALGLIMSVPRMYSVPLLVMLSVICPSRASQAQAVLQDRIIQPIDRSSVSRLTGSLNPVAKVESDQGKTENSKVIGGMTINFKRTEAQEATLKALLQAQQNPTSPSYHQWLTQEQFGQLFGMSAADLDKVSAWLQQEGFTINWVAQSSNSLSFSGTIANVERAFQTQIHDYDINGETHFANATQIALPSALAAAVNSVRGLNDLRLKPRLQFVKMGEASSNPHFTSGLTGAHYLTPQDFAIIYDVNSLYQAGNTGEGVTVAVIGQTDIVPADISDFRGAAGLSVNNPTIFTVPGQPALPFDAGAFSGDLGQTDLDLEWSGGVATGASIVLVNSPDVITSLQYAIQNRVNGITIPIISLSYGDCESSFSQLYGDLNSIESWLEQANSQGQTVVSAAGNSGAADCDRSFGQTVTSATQGLAVDYPGSSAYVTDVGGSEFMGDGTALDPEAGSGTYWSANGSGTVSDDLMPSAKSYIPEMAWNDTTFFIATGRGLDAGGGGVSAIWPKPSWQIGVPGIPADSHRDVPDVSLNSSNEHDAYLYCTQIQTQGSGTSYVSSCQANSFRTSDLGQTDNNSLITAGGATLETGAPYLSGTVAAPAFAGLLAIIEQKLGSGGLGNINPALYRLAANSTTYASAFHDITTGNNQVPCTTGSLDCPSGSNPAIGYVAGTGYDQATGLGSVEADNLATAFSNLLSTTTGTRTALTVAPGTSVVIGQNLTFTATVVPNTLKAAPTGTVTFIIDGVAQALPTALSTTAPYTAAFNCSFPSSGTHSVWAVYSSGNATYTGSASNTETITVAAQGIAPTTTTVTISPTSFPLNSSISLSATVTATTASTLTGPLTFSTGGTTIGTVNQGTIGTSNTATATLFDIDAVTSLGFVNGTDTITATYGGDTFNASSSGTTRATVSSPGITLSATNITIASAAPGNSGSSTVTINSVGGYAGTVTISASASTLIANYGFLEGGVQASAPCTFSLLCTGTKTISVGLAPGCTPTMTGCINQGSQTVVITITTMDAIGNLEKGQAGSFRKAVCRIAATEGAAASCILILLIPDTRRKRWPMALTMLVFLCAGAGSGCGGGGPSGASPAGTYTVVVTGVDSYNSNIANSTKFTVTIQ
jgi:Pro-kumamolisin, activation domain/Bacterial Ig-like domain (group 3)